MKRERAARSVSSYTMPNSTVARVAYYARCAVDIVGSRARPRLARALPGGPQRVVWAQVWAAMVCAQAFGGN
eukprot:3431809-Lingulodinium_polyedra.AAC.1